MDKKRRELLAAGAAVAGSCILPPVWAAAAEDPAARIRFDPAPFTLGVASGDPTESAVIIWTRVAPDPFAPRGGLSGPQPVTWVVATDARMGNIVARGTAVALPAQAGAVHIDVKGLKPDTEYFYAFWAGNSRSVVGRTKTVPAAGVDRARFAVVSCQSIENGRYAAFERIVEEKPDFLLHLGDYIYEHKLNQSWPAAVRKEADDLESYRARYSLYKGDPQLRAAHQAMPWIVTWDNHEVAASDWNFPHPAFQSRRAVAYQAWYENMPIRLPAGLPDGRGGFRIYRQLAYGNLIDLVMLDARQHRDAPPCSPYWDPVACRDQDLDNPDRKMLGTEQKQWLKQTLSASKAAWRCIGSSLLMSDVKLGSVTPYTLPWQGYRAERSDILGHIADNNMRNVVILSGDWHRAIVCNVKRDYDDIAAPDIATEFCGSALTSNGDGFRGGLSTFIARVNFYPLNLHMRFYESELNGYFVCDVTRSSWTSTYRVVDRSKATSPAHTLAVFEVANGRPGIKMVSGDGGNPFPRGKA